MYRTMRLNIMVNYEGFYTEDDFYKLTVEEYENMMVAVAIRQVNNTFDIHRQAFENIRIQSMEEKNGKQVPMYKTFNDFYDYGAEYERVTGINISDAAVNDVSEQELAFAKASLLARAASLKRQGG